MNPELPRPDRALVIVAHPDDEAWLFGGAIAAWSEAGSVVHVLCVTAGEKGGDRRGLVQGEDAVDALRTGELAHSCARLGATHAVLGLPDGGLATFPVERGEAVIHTQISAFGPDLILTHGPAGEYGHGDHVAVHRWVASVAGTVQVATAVAPLDAMRTVFRRLRKHGFAGLAPIEADALEIVANAQVTLHSPDAKQSAIAAHASQLRDGDPNSFLLPGLTVALLTAEYYRC